MHMFIKPQGKCHMHIIVWRDKDAKTKVFSLLAGSFFGFAFNAGPSQMQSLWAFLVFLFCPCLCLKILCALFLFSDSVPFLYILTTYTYCLYKHTHIQMYNWRLLWKMWRKWLCGISFYYCVTLHLMASPWSGDILNV